MLQPSLIVLTIVAAGLALQGYYFGYLRPPRALAWLQQATFVLMSFLILPLLLYTLYQQAGAADRLSNIGIAPHPNILHSVGLTVGKGANPVWVFQARPFEETNLRFYDHPENRKG